MTTVLGRYTLQGRLGAGGMAEVWLARASGPSGFEKQVVVKRILPQLAGDDTVEELFKTEARLAGRLDHPNLVQVFDFGREPNGALALVMEFVDGASLRAVVNAVRKGAQLDVRVAARIIALACEGLHAAHELNDEHGPMLLVHRDITPENILLARSGAVKVADFGIARVHRSLQLTGPNSFRGKVGYAAPEQVLGEPVSRQADIWAIGATLFELLTGEQVFVTSTDAELVSATVERTPRRVRAVRADCPVELEAIVAKCLERDPSKRWATAHQVSEQLERFISWTGDPLRSSDLGRVFERLGIKPPTLTDERAPVASAAFTEQLMIESSSFEPRAELAADGSLHALEGQARPPASIDPPSEPAEAPPELALSVDRRQVPAAPSSLGESPSPRSARYARLELTTLAEQVEPEQPAPAASPPPRRRRFSPALLMLGLALTLVVAGAAFGLRSRLSQPRARTGSLLIESSPSSALVSVNGNVVGETPWAGDNPPVPTTVVTISREGYRDAVLRFDGGVDWRGTVPLQRVKR